MVIIKATLLIILLSFIGILIFELLRCIDSSWSGKLKDLFKF